MKLLSEHRKEYSEIKRILQEAYSTEMLNKGQLKVLEYTIFKSLPQVCARCGKTEHLTLDHIVPKALLLDLGVDVERESNEGNYQVLCQYCNHKKSCRLDVREPKVKEILLKLIARI